MFLNALVNFFTDDDIPPRKLQRGDVIGVSRLCYEHYGVYISNDEVIHYTSIDSDVGNNKIMATTFERFMRGASDFFILNFPDSAGKAKKSIGIRASTMAVPFIPGGNYPAMPSLFDLLRRSNYRRYTAEEIVSRARSRLGEDHYSLMFNNCEHFAIWCATNVNESQQIQKLLDEFGRFRINY